MAILSTLEPTTLDGIIRWAFKITKYRIGEPQVCNLRTTHSSVLNCIQLWRFLPCDYFYSLIQIFSSDGY